MKRIRAYEHNATDLFIPFGRGHVALEIVTPPTLAHERHADKYNAERVQRSGYSHREMAAAMIEFNCDSRRHLADAEGNPYRAELWASVY